MSTSGTKLGTAEIARGATSVSAAGPAGADDGGGTLGVDGADGVAGA
jgi:hypothetical protein